MSLQRPLHGKGLELCAVGVAGGARVDLCAAAVVVRCHLSLNTKDKILFSCVTRVFIVVVRVRVRVGLGLGLG